MTNLHQIPFHLYRAQRTLILKIPLNPPCASAGSLTFYSPALVRIRPEMWSESKTIKEQKWGVGCVWKCIFLNKCKCMFQNFRDSLEEFVKKIPFWSEEEPILRRLHADGKWPRMPQYGGPEVLKGEVHNVERSNLQNRSKGFDPLCSRSCSNPLYASLHSLGPVFIAFAQQIFTDEKIVKGMAHTTYVGSGGVMVLWGRMLKMAWSLTLFLFDSKPVLYSEEIFFVFQVRTPPVVSN